MPHGWILQSKLTPPSPPPGWLRRRLGAPESLPIAAEPPVTLLVAGPGCGKTLGLLALFEASTDPTVWYSLDAHDAEVATFFHHLIAGVQAHVPAFGETVRAMLASERTEPRLLWQGFFDSLAACRLPAFRLVLDDFQHLIDHQPELAAALGYWFDKLPPGVRLLVASRRKLGVPLSRLAARGVVRLLGTAELHFTPEEQAAFLVAHAGPGGVSEALRQAADRLDGWPLGLALACTGGAGAGSLRDYVSEELYQSQPAPLRQAMVQAALLAEVTPEACREVFGDPEAAVHLEALAEAHLLQGLLGGAGYRFPTYLQAFLAQELERSVPRETREGWHARAAAFYAARGQAVMALPHRLAAGDWIGAREACRAIFPAMRFDGRHAQLRRFLDAFPDDWAAGDAWCRLWRAHLASYAGQSAEALAMYAEARALYMGDGATGAAGVFKALVGECNTALTLQREAEFRALLAAAAAHAGDRHAEDEVDLRLIQAYDAERQGDMAGMRERNEAALALPIGANVDIAASHCIALINLATHTLYQGDTAQARRFLGQAIAIAGEWRFDGYRLGAMFSLAHLHVLEGDLAGAGAMLDAQPPLWQEALDWHDVAIAHTVLGAYRLARGEWDASEQALEHAMGLFERAGFTEGRQVPLERLVALAIAKGEYARAVALASDGPAEDAHNVHALALALMRARALHLDGRVSEALAGLESALPALEALGARLHVARGRLYESASRLASEDRAGARSALAAAQTLMAANGHGFLRDQEPVLWASLADLLVEPIAGAGVTAALQLRVLGPFEVRLGGELLDRWPRRKARVLLAALALHPQGMRADDLAELVGHGEAHPANVLRVNAWALRRALEPGLGRGEPSRYLLIVGDRYRLNPEWLEPSDMAAFDAALAEAEALKEPSPREAARRLEQAVAWVRGDLLEEGGPFAVFGPWREAFRRRCLDVLYWLCAHYRRTGDYGRAEAALVRAIALAPADEEAYVAVMRLYRAQGQMERLRRAYWDCRAALKRHEELVPSEAFEATYRELLGPGH